MVSLSVPGYPVFSAVIRREDYKVQKSKVGSIILVYAGYSYGLQRLNNSCNNNLYRCTRHSAKCTARARLNTDGSLELRNLHNHPPTGRTNFSWEEILRLNLKNYFFNNKIFFIVNFLFFILFSCIAQRLMSVHYTFTNIHFIFANIHYIFTNITFSTFSLVFTNIHYIFTSFH